MAIVGHWLPSFLLAYLLPDASATFFCKLAMLSDALFGVFVLFRLERAGIYTNWMVTPPPGTQRLMAEWQEKGLWEHGVDRMPGEDGFRGWTTCCFAFYTDLSYSHSVELMALLAVPVIAFAQLRWRIRLPQAIAIFLVMVSHPLMDMIFHDAYFMMGNRAKSRVSLELWQVPWNAPFTFCLEMAVGYGSYRLWLSGREPIKQDEATGREILRWKGHFWKLAVGHNMASFYVVGPLLSVILYHVTPGGFGFADDTEWTYVMFAVMLWSWTVALYPLYKIEQLTVPVPRGAGAAYMKLDV